jgi:hypothetical protein
MVERPTPVLVVPPVVGGRVVGLPVVLTTEPELFDTQVEPPKPEDRLAGRVCARVGQGRQLPELDDAAAAQVQRGAQRCRAAVDDPLPR